MLDHEAGFCFATASASLTQQQPTNTECSEYDHHGFDQRVQPTEIPQDDVDNIEPLGDRGRSLKIVIRQSRVRRLTVEGKNQRCPNQSDRQSNGQSYPVEPDGRRAFLAGYETYRQCEEHCRQHFNQ